MLQNWLMPYTSNPKVTLIDEDGDAVKVTPEGSLQVDIGSQLTLDNAQINVNLDESGDSVQVFGNDGAANRAIKTTDGGVLLVDQSGFSDMADNINSISTNTANLDVATQQEAGLVSQAIQIAVRNGNDTSRSKMLHTSDDGTFNGLRVDTLHNGTMLDFDDWVVGTTARALTTGLGALTRLREVTLQAHPDNTAKIRFGASTITTSRGLILEAGDMVTFPIRSSATAYVIAENATDKLCLTALQGQAV